LLKYKHVSNWALVVRSEAEGRVKSILGKNMVQFTPTPKDMGNLRRGFRVLSEMMFAAGAKEVWPNLHEIPILRSPDDLKHWDNMPLDARSCGMMLSHLFGSTRMGSDERSSVVGLDFQVHGVRGLYVLDSSIFPTNLGVNPQHTIMAVARLGATRVAERPLPARS
jgi:choline dehydrogenase-like flavoprotein